MKFIISLYLPILIIIRINKCRTTTVAAPAMYGTAASAATRRNCRHDSGIRRSASAERIRCRHAAHAPPTIQQNRAHPLIFDAECTYLPPFMVREKYTQCAQLCVEKTFESAIIGIEGGTAPSGFATKKGKVDLVIVLRELY